MSNLFSQILNMSMTGSVVILFVMAARLLLKKSPKIFSYALWSVVLFRLLCPVAFTAPVSVLDVMEPDIRQASQNTTTVVYLPNNVDLRTDFVAAPAENQTVHSEEAREPAQQLRMTPMHAIALIWAAGAVGMMLYSIVQYLSLRRKLIGAMQLRGNVYLADNIDTAFVMGILNPRIYLPSSVPKRERIYILAHEKHHIHRFDHIIKLLAYLALCIHWFNPLVWLAFILAGKDMEMSCDEAVIKRLGSEIRADYSASLLRLATHKNTVSGIPLAFGEGDTKGRVRNMAKWKKPKVWVSVICVVLCLVILVACGVNPRSAQEQTVIEDPLESCRQVLESVQSGSYEIVTHQQNIGPDTINPESTIHDWYHGGNWMQIHSVPESGFTSTFAYLHVDGQYYESISSSATGEAEQPSWQESAYQGNIMPWLATFPWEESVVEISTVETTASGTTVHLTVKEPFVHGILTTPQYTVDFTFDEDGQFLVAALSADFRDESGIQSGIVRTMQIRSQDALAIDSAILASLGQTEASEPAGEIAAAVNAEDPASLVYGSLQMSLPEEYTCRENDGTVILMKNGADVGGITCYSNPEFSLDMEFPDYNWMEWLRAMGLPEAQESEEPIAYMMGGSLYGDLEAEFFNELHPEELNVEHHFFIDGSLVYDVYYDQNTVSDIQAEKFLKTIQLGGTPVVPEKPEEQAALEKCRSILDAIQSGTCHIYSNTEREGIPGPTAYSSEYLRSGDDFLSIAFVPVGENVEKHANMYVRGRGFHNRGNWAEEDIVWTEGSAGDGLNPWCTTYQWNPEAVTYEDTLTDENGDSVVMLRIDEPFALYSAETECYFADFYFKKDGSLVKIWLKADFLRDGEVCSVEVTESIQSLVGSSIASRIDKEYQRAIG